MHVISTAARTTVTCQLKSKSTWSRSKLYQSRSSSMTKSRCTSVDNAILSDHKHDDLNGSSHAFLPSSGCRSTWSSVTREGLAAPPATRRRHFMQPYRMLIEMAARCGGCASRDPGGLEGVGLFRMKHFFQMELHVWCVLYLLLGGTAC